MPKPKDPLEKHALSLACNGELPAILRLLADKLDTGEALAEHFTAKVSRESFELAAFFHLVRSH